MKLPGMIGDRPGLLVSVRNVREAQAALAGRADVIDVKEPARGALGAADATTIGDIVRVVANRAVVTAAAGELVDFQIARPSWSDSNDDTQETRQKWSGDVDVPDGVALFKFGLAGCGRGTEWRKSLAALPNKMCPVPVVYADWRAAEAPDPSAVLEVAIELSCVALLVDTWDKSAGTLFDHWPADDLRTFVRQIHSAEMAAVLAGSLSLSDLKCALICEPDLIAVRGAACEGGRNGTVSRERVAELRQAMAFSNGLLRRS